FHVTGVQTCALPILLLTVAAAFTSFYSWRLIFMTFHGKPRASADVMHHVHESPPVMLVPLFVLATGALAAGFIFEPYFIGEHYRSEERRVGKEGRSR